MKIMKKKNGDEFKSLLICQLYTRTPFHMLHMAIVASELLLNIDLVGQQQTLKFHFTYFSMTLSLTLQAKYE